jgi:hypothetical protein
MLHVMNGTSIRPIFERANLPGVMTVYADPLHDGPVPAAASGGSASALSAVRLQVRLDDQR